VNPPMNLLLGWYFIRAYRRVHVDFSDQLRSGKGNGDRL
jgi:hypothetical protein